MCVAGATALGGCGSLLCLANIRYFLVRGKTPSMFKSDLSGLLFFNNSHMYCMPANACNCGTCLSSAVQFTYPPMIFGTVHRYANDYKEKEKHEHRY